MPKKKLIFPENWPMSMRRLKDWKTERVQRNICPQCHHYTGRYIEDQCCQKCGYRPKPLANFQAKQRRKFIKKWAEELQILPMLPSLRMAKNFIEEVIKAWGKNHED